jgi:hypothetical protein
VSESFPGTLERRRSPRVDLLADLHGHVVTLDERVQVRQLNELGMTIETTAPLSPRSPHEFRISLDDLMLRVRGRVVHNRVLIRGDVVTYVAGVEFVDLTPEGRAVIVQIVERAAPRPD